MTALPEVAAALRAGSVAVIPTDTVYGVAALPSCAGAIFGLKRRSRAKALPVLGSGIEQVRSVAEVDDVVEELATRAWPGPLTIVLPRAGGFTDDLGGTERATVAVRVPAHPLTLELLRATGPLAVTSANVSGEAPATTFEDACSLFPPAVCLDGGTCDGRPSTIVSLVGEPRVLRSGELPEEEVLGWIRARRTGS